VGPRSLVCVWKQDGQSTTASPGGGARDCHCAGLVSGRRARSQSRTPASATTVIQAHPPAGHRGVVADRGVGALEELATDRAPGFDWAHRLILCAATDARAAVELHRGQVGRKVDGAVDEVVSADSRGRRPFSCSGA